MSEALTTSAPFGSFAAIIDEAKRLVGTDDNAIENVIVIVAKTDGAFHTLTDVNVPITITMAMMEGAARAIFETKLQRKVSAANDPS